MTVHLVSNCKLSLVKYAFTPLGLKVVVHGSGSVALHECDRSMTFDLDIVSTSVHFFEYKPYFQFRR